MLGLMGKTCLFFNISGLHMQNVFGALSAFVHDLVHADPRNVLLFG
jgi:hypothetical protein